MDFRAEYEKWCTDPYFDEATKAELKAIAGDDKEIEDRFYRTLEFGTAGLRGVIGAGTNRMNIYTVRQATQGLANYILSQGEDAVKRGVAIAHDSRNMHDEFTDATALCLAANGIKTYVFPQLAPVPELSYAVRTLGTIAGVVITASHNPREYNGYKVYWEDGAQVTPPHDTSIMAEVAKVTSFDQVKTMDKAAAIEAGLYNVISDEVEEGYFGELRKLSIHPEIIKARQRISRLFTHHSTAQDFALYRECLRIWALRMYTLSQARQYLMAIFLHVLIQILRILMHGSSRLSWQRKRMLISF